MEMEVLLSEEDVKQILKEHLQQKFKSVGDVKLEVGSETRGHAYNEYQTTVFKRAKCKIEY